MEELEQSVKQTKKDEEMPKAKFALFEKDDEDEEGDEAEGSDGDADSDEEKDDFGEGSDDEDEDDDDEDDDEDDDGDIEKMSKKLEKREKKKMWVVICWFCGRDSWHFSKDKHFIFLYLPFLEFFTMST